MADTLTHEVAIRRATVNDAADILDLVNRYAADPNVQASTPDWRATLRNEVPC